MASLFGVVLVAAFRFIRYAGRRLSSRLLILARVQSFYLDIMVALRGEEILRCLQLIVA